MVLGGSRWFQGVPGSSAGFRYDFVFVIDNGAELAGATGARAPVLFLPRPEILGHILYVLSRFSGPK